MTTINFAVEHRGCRLHAKLRGDGTPVLLVQGVGLHGDGWLPQVEGLAHRHQCLWFDNRGMGLSQPIGAKVTVAQMAEDALALMDAQGWASAHVVGHSLGGAIAQELALSAPTRVRSLSLLCTFARGRDVTRPTPWLMWIGLRTRLGPRRARRRAFLSIVMPPGAVPDGEQDALAAKLEPLFGHDLADSPPIVMKQVAAMSRYDSTPRLGELALVPTLVVNCKYDRIAPPARGRAMAAGIPGARYVEYDDASHGVTIQHAGRINALLAEHIAGAEAARRAR